MARYSVDLYRSLSLDGQPCFYESGSIEVAITPERWEDLKRKQGHALAWGIEAHLIDPRESGRLVPPIRTDHALWRAVCSVGRHRQGRCGWRRRWLPMPSAGRSVLRAHACTGHRGAAWAGCRRCIRPQGRIATEHVLVCAGIWGPRIGRMAGVSIPLMPVQHQYARTAPLPELAGETERSRSPSCGSGPLACTSGSMAIPMASAPTSTSRSSPSPDQILPYGEAPVMPSIMPFTAAGFRPGPARRHRPVPVPRGGQIALHDQWHVLLHA